MKIFETYTITQRLKEMESLKKEILKKESQLQYFDLKKLKDYKKAQIEKLRNRLKAMEIEARKFEW